MNRDNVKAALDDEEIQVLADRCHAAMISFASTLAARDFVLAAILAAERESSFSIEFVAQTLLERSAGFVLSERDVREYGVAFEDWLTTGSSDFEAVRPPSLQIH